MKKNKKHKLVHLVSDLSIGGVASIVIDLCNQANKARYDVSIISLSKKLNMLDQKPLAEHINLYTFDYVFDPDYSLRRYIYLIINESIVKKAANDIVEKISEINPDIIHFHVNPRELQIASIINKKIEDINLIYTDHCKRIGKDDYSYVNRALLKFVYRKWYSNFNIISVSKSVERSNADNRFFNPNNHHKLIENKVSSLDDFTRHPNSKYIDIIYIARLSRVKGHYDLLNAWKMLGDRHNCRLWLIGDGELEGDLKTYVKEHITNKSVNFTGAVANVHHYLSFADIGVFPSYKEGLPLALLEQLMVGIPMITSNIEELTDIIKHNVNGLIFQLGNKKDLFEKMELLIANTELQKRLGVKAKEMANKRFKDGPLIKHYEFFYDELFNK